MTDRIYPKSQTVLRISSPLLDAVYAVEKRSLVALAKAARGNPKTFFVGRNFKGQSFTDIDLRGVNLSRADLRGTHLRGAIIDATTNLFDAKMDQDDSEDLRQRGLIPPLSQFSREALIERLRSGEPIPDGWTKYSGDLDLSDLEIGKDWLRLSQFYNLSTLNLARTDFYDLEVLFRMSYLQTLDLSSTLVSSVGGIGNLVDLQYLDISQTKVIDFSPLRTLANLRKLNISGTKVQSDEQLTGCAALRDLDISHTEISQIAEITRLQHLSRLNISGTKIDSTVDLMRIPSLMSLRMRSCTAMSWPELRDLSWLLDIDIGDNDLDEVDFISQMPNLISLSLSGCRNVERLPSSLPVSMEVLGIARTKISSLDTLQRCRRISHIIANHSRLSHLPSTIWSSVRSLILSSTGLEKLRPDDAKLLSRLDIARTGIDNLKFVSAMPNLEWLDASYTKLKSVRSLGSSHKLKHLSIRGTQVRVVAALASAKNLSFCDLTDTPVEDISALTRLTELLIVIVAGTNVKSVPTFLSKVDIVTKLSGGVSVSD